MHKTLVVLGASHEHRIAITDLKDAGYRVIAVDGNPDSPAKDIVDGFVRASIYSPEEVLNNLTSYLIQADECVDGIMAVACDAPMTVAYVASKLELPSIGLGAARLVSNKADMLEALNNHVPIPRYVIAESAADITDALRLYPMVIKPLDNRGARGVFMISGSDKLHKLASESARYCVSDHRLMLQEYLDGPQLSVEGMMIDGVAHIPIIFDRNYADTKHLLPNIIENGGEMPSKYAHQYGYAIVDTMTWAGRALGIYDGPIKGDLVIHDGTIYVIEIAGRMSGGFMGTLAAPWSIGVNITLANAEFATEGKCNPDHLWHTGNRAAVIRFAWPERTGRYRAQIVHPVLDSSDGDRVKVIDMSSGTINFTGANSHHDRPIAIVAASNTVECAMDIASNVDIIWNEVV